MTQVNEAQDAVYAALVARAAQVGSPMNVAQGANQAGQVPVSFGDPATDTQPEHVWVRDTANVTLIPATSGSAQPTFTEEFHVTVEIFVQRSGDDPATVRTRATAILEDVIATIGTYAITTSAGLLDSWLDGHNWTTAASTEVRSVSVTVELFCRGGPA